MWTIRKVATFAIVSAMILLVLAGPVQAPSSLGLDPIDKRGDDPDTPDGPSVTGLPVEPIDTSSLLYVEDECGNQHRITWRLLGPPAVCPGDGSQDTAEDPERTISPLLAIEPSTRVEQDATYNGVRPDEPGVRTTTVANKAPTSDTARWPAGYRLAVLVAAVTAAVLVPILLRIRTKDDNEIRSRIYERVVDDPGVSASSLAEELDIHLTTAIYHLDVLQDQDRIEGLDQGRSTLYFENHRKYGRIEKRLLTALRKDTPSRLLELVVENPGIHCAEIARQLDLSRTSVKYHTDRLIDDGLIEEDRRGGILQLNVPDRAQDLFKQYATPA